MDLEDAIYLAWRTSDDLDLFFKHYCDHPTPMTEDQVANMICGIKQMHDMRMEQLFDKYKQINKLDEYTTDSETLANRQKLFKTIEEITKLKKSKK